jgi:hypothetical protein
MNSEYNQAKIVEAGKNLKNVAYSIIVQILISFTLWGIMVSDPISNNEGLIAIFFLITILNSFFLIYSIFLAGESLIESSSKTVLQSNSLLKSNEFVSLKFKIISIGKKPWNDLYKEISDLNKTDKTIWRLPTIDELKYIYENKKNYKINVADYYWTNNENGNSFASVLDFNDGKTMVFYKILEVETLLITENG